jgi:hypothetical protein
MTRPKIIIDGRKDAEWLHGGRNWFIADPPPPDIPACALRDAAISFWGGFAVFTFVVVSFIALIGWAFG